MSAFTSRMFEPVFRLMAPLDPMWQGVLLGVPIAFLALLVYRGASNQAEIARTKDAITANLLALRLFRDDLGVVLPAQGRIFLLVGRYLRLGLVPLAILFVPVVLVLVEIEARFAYRPIVVGESALVTLSLDHPLVPAAVTAVLIAPKGVSVETPAFRFESERSIMWRILPTAAGGHELKVRLDDREVLVRVWAGSPRPEILVPSIHQSDDIRTFGSPGEAAIEADSAISEISVGYEPAEKLLWGLSPASWAMFISSLLFGFGLRRPLGVEF